LRLQAAVAGMFSFAVASSGRRNAAIPLRVGDIPFADDC